MTLLVLVRHGQASWGSSDYDVLSEHGHEQARSLGAAWARTGFAPTRLISGTMRRHRETADGIRSGLDTAPAYTTMPGLEEYDHLDVLAESLQDGVLPEPDESDNRALFDAALRRWVTGESDRAYRESYLDFRQRVRTAFATLLGGLDDSDKAVAVTSGGVIAGIVCDLLGIDAQRWPALTAPIVNSSVHKILVREQQPMLLSFNEHGHLAIRDVTYA